MKADIKKYLLRAAIVVPFLLGVVYIYYRTPKLIRVEYDGIYYQLGNPEMEEKLPVIFDGYLTRGLWLEDSFQGTITIGDKTLNQVNMRLPKDGSSVIVYMDDITKDYASYGALYTKDIKKSFSINVFQYDQETDSDVWSSSDGYMLSGPANNCREALELSNQLMKGELNKELK
jgi:hypothetical protein